MIEPAKRMDAIRKENEELIAIISKGVGTAKKNNQKK